MATRVLVVGLGEVGSALYDLLLKSSRFEVYGYDVDPSRTKCKLEDVPLPLNYLYVTIPYSPSFVSAVVEYAQRVRARAVFIHSTVAPGTTRRVHELLNAPVAYTPVRGRHPRIREHMRLWAKWVSALPPEYLLEATKHLEEAGFKVRACSEPPESLELAKLWETVYRAALIAAWQEAHRVARKCGASLRVVAEFVGEVHEVLRDRPVYYPDYIGGHCLIPNTEILRGFHPSKLFDFVIESNELRREELGDLAAKREVDELKELFYRMTRSEYYA